MEQLQLRHLTFQHIKQLLLKWNVKVLDFRSDFAHQFPCLLVSFPWNSSKCIHKLHPTHPYFTSGINYSSLSNGPRPGMPLQSWGQRAARLWGIRAKPLNRDLGNVRTWPHYHYLIRQFNAIGGWEKVRLRYKLCKCRCKLNDLVQRLATLSPLSFLPPNPVVLLTPIQLPHPLGPFFPTLLRLEPLLP